MIEKKVKEVFLIYLKNKREYSRPRSIHSRGADILIKGKAYEIKGSDFGKTRAIKQLISYAFDYERVNLVLPYDALNFTFLYQLEAIEKFLSHPTSCSIGAYLVTEKTDRIYAIYRFSSLNILNSKVNTLLYQMITNERPPLIVVFNFWFHLAYSYLILDEETRNLYAQFQTNFNLNPENRAQFLNLLPYIIMLRR